MSTPAATPTEIFLSSLRLRTVLLLTPEKKPPALAVWCAQNRIHLVHLGLGALADSTASAANAQRKSSKHREPTSAAPNDALGEGDGDVHATEIDERGFIDAHLPADGLMPWQAINASHPSRMVSLERIVKDALQVILDGSRLPCLICDMTGVNETGVVVGCLRRIQRFNYASIRREYQAFAGSRARSSHERFIEVSRAREERGQNTPGHGCARARAAKT